MTRLKELANQLGLNKKQMTVALCDFLEGKITALEVKDPDYLLENYFTPSTYYLFGQLASLRMTMTKKQAITELNKRYKITPAQYKALEELE